MIYTLPLELVPIDETGFHLAADITVDGREMRVIIDSGASKTAFDLGSFPKPEPGPDDQEALSAGLGTSEMESYFIEVEEMNLGSLRIKNASVVLIDLSHVNASYEMLGLKEVDGVLGADVFVEYEAVIDYKRMELRLFVDGRKSR